MYIYTNFLLPQLAAGSNRSSRRSRLKGALQLLSNRYKYIRFAQVPERNSVSSSGNNLSAIYPWIRNNSEEASDDVSKLKRLLCYESQHQSQSDEKSLEKFGYEKAVSNYLGTQSTFNPNPP